VLLELFVVPPALPHSANKVVLLFKCSPASEVGVYVVKHRSKAPATTSKEQWGRIVIYKWSF